MDKNGLQSDSSYWYKTVLKKLKQMLMESRLQATNSKLTQLPPPYEFCWSGAESRAKNVNTAAAEDAALSYLERASVVKTNRTNPELEYSSVVGLFGDFDEPLHGYHEKVWIFSIDLDSFSREVARFGLIDTGAELTEKPSDFGTASPPSAPPLVQRIADGFALHEESIISFDGHVIGLDPAVRKIAAHIMHRYTDGLSTSIENILDNCVDEDYLERAGASGDEHRVHNYVRHRISEARIAFRVSTGINKNYFPRQDIGYTFSP